jgi:ComF family protein
VTTAYEGVAAQLIKSLKFETKRQASEPIAHMMVDMLPAGFDEYLVCPLPTASARVRERGFDHAKLIARNFSMQTGLQRAHILGRRTNIRQLGATRSQRLIQMADEFFVQEPSKVSGRSILLIDDVVTTGASISAAAKVLKKAGAKRVVALVFAQKL